MINLWQCKLGGPLETTMIPEHFDDIARALLEALYAEMVGQPPQFMFSSWDGSLSESERRIMHDRYPETPEYQ